MVAKAAPRLDAIEIDSVSPHYASTPGGRGFLTGKYRFRRGENIQIVAPSGGGKTTLFSCMSGMRKDYSGSIRLLAGGTEVPSGEEDQWSLIRARNLSVVFQDIRIFPSLTLRENLEMNPATGPKPKFDEICERLGLGGFLDRKAATLSRGEQQRCAIARALLRPFDFLLLDEPFSHLDHDRSFRAASLIQDICSEQEAGLIRFDLEPDDIFAPSIRIKL